MEEVVTLGLLVAEIGGRNMIQEILAGILVAIIVLFPPICLGLTYRYYRKYYTLMKSTHHEEWSKLMNKDTVIELVGEWERWPFGSWYLIASFFKTEETYGDQLIADIKRKGSLFLKLFAISFPVSFAIILFLPKL